MTLGRDLKVLVNPQVPPDQVWFCKEADFFKSLDYPPVPPGDCSLDALRYTTCTSPGAFASASETTVASLLKALSPRFAVERAVPAVKVPSPALASASIFDSVWYWVVSLLIVVGIPVLHWLFW